MNTAPVIDFYLLPSADESGMLVFICKLAEKASHRGNYVFIHCPQPALANQLDECLYSFRPDSFLPHCQIKPPLHAATFNQPTHPLLISSAQHPLPARWLAINMHDHCYEGAERIAELVINDASAKTISRQKFSWYKQQGFELRTHKI